MAKLLREKFLWLQGKIFIHWKSFIASFVMQAEKETF